MGYLRQLADPDSREYAPRDWVVALPPDPTPRVARLRLIRDAIDLIYWLGEDIPFTAGAVATIYYRRTSDSQAAKRLRQKSQQKAKPGITAKVDTTTPLGSPLHKKAFTMPANRPKLTAIFIMSCAPNAEAAPPAKGSKSKPNKPAQPKAPPFSVAEVELLSDQISDFRHILENKTSDAVMRSEKKSAWEKIAISFTQNGFTRTPEQLLNKWNALKKKSRSEFAAERRSFRKTGGGTADESQTVSAISQKVSAICSSYSIHEGSNLADCDAAVLTEAKNIHVRRKKLIQTKIAPKKKPPTAYSCSDTDSEDEEVETDDSEESASRPNGTVPIYKVSKTAKLIVSAME
ncbi:unnamed protein product [Bemisia tabaci]|uniref:Regulatory protein zeste n=1 Tax=Bemisia tabaci TaxID=7038 RepID=A0A9P0AGT9_BEMTA|nr:unnamed protein product [Bemisia tabaci]